MQSAPSPAHNRRRPLLFAAALLCTLWCCACSDDEAPLETKPEARFSLHAATHIKHKGKSLLPSGQG
ncbi:hypothetical protein KKF84_11070, partial [Myxococcota bacterium]|nr:hypothetical protein [Myxococcota bacterium]